MRVTPRGSTIPATERFLDALYAYKRLRTRAATISWLIAMLARDG